MLVSYLVHSKTAALYRITWVESGRRLERYVGSTKAATRFINQHHLKAEVNRVR